jgi:hypothetical protein
VGVGWGRGRGWEKMGRRAIPPSVCIEQASHCPASFTAACASLGIHGLSLLFPPLPLCALFRPLYRFHDCTWLVETTVGLFHCSFIRVAAWLCIRELNCVFLFHSFMQVLLLTFGLCRRRLIPLLCRRSLGRVRVLQPQRDAA